MKIFIPFFLFYVIGAIVLFLINKFSIQPQDGGFGVFALAMIAFMILVFGNMIINIYWGFQLQNQMYFVIAFLHFAILAVGLAKLVF